MPAQNFEELEVWKHAHELVLRVYSFSASFPKHEMFGLSSQLRRAAVSVPANIAEGFVKRGISDKLRFYNISQGSLNECRYYFILARDLGYGKLKICCVKPSPLRDYSTLTFPRFRAIGSAENWKLGSGSQLIEVAAIPTPHSQLPTSQ